jgi:hypothetical protein
MQVNAKNQLLCLWAGLAAIILFFIGYWFMAGLVPPPSPNDTAHQVVLFWSHNVTLTRFGLVVTLLAGTLTGPWVAVIATQMKRIEGEHSPLTWTQLGLGMISVLVFLFPVIVMLAILFRPGRDPQLILMMDDLSWLPFVGLFMPAMVQGLAIALAIFKDKEEKVFPRWLGYFNVWVALLFIPDILIYSFKTGPFAWNGLIGFWVALSIFGIWFFVMFPYLRRAILSQAAEADAAAAGPAAPATAALSTAAPAHGPTAVTA